MFNSFDAILETVEHLKITINRRFQLFLVDKSFNNRGDLIIDNNSLIFAIVVANIWTNVLTYSNITFFFDKIAVFLDFITQTLLIMRIIKEDSFLT